MAKPKRKRPPPAYQEYASDLLADIDYRSMTLGERGLFHTLRLECWVNGKFHSDHRLLAAMLNIPEASIEKAFTPLVQRKFKRVGDCFVSEELENYREELLDRHGRIVAGGSVGGRRTQQNHRENRDRVQGGLKPLSGDELNRGELNGVGLARGGENKEESEWLHSYKQEEATQRRQGTKYNN